MDLIVKSQQTSSNPVTKVIVRPLVLLSIVDHFNRLTEEGDRTPKRFVGVLLGTSFKGIVDVSNSYAVPFEEDVMDPGIWFLDLSYHEKMFSLFKKLKANVHVVGWYSTGPNLRGNDLDIHRLFHNYVPNPVLVISNVQSNEFGIPTKAYYDVDEVKENATQKSQKVFVPVYSEFAIDEVDEIVVEHLLRNVKDTTITTLATQVSDRLTALKGLDARLIETCQYLDMIIGWLPLNHETLYPLQDFLSRLPNLNDPELRKACTVKTNDMMLVIFLCSLIRCVIALHNLINNKILYQEYEKSEEAKAVEVPADDNGVP